MEETTVDPAQQAAEFKAQGNEFFKKKEYAKAIELYSKAIDLSPTDPSYFGNRAACYLALKKYNKCIEDCDETLRLDRNFVKAWMRKGRSYYYLGQLEEAKTCYRTAIELDSNDKVLKSELDEVLQVEKMLGSARKDIGNNKFTSALGEVKQVLKICPDSVEAKIIYLEALIKMGNIDQAISLSTEYFRELSTNVNFLYFRGLALCYNGQVDAAKKTWTEAMRLDPDFSTCRLALRRMNRQEEAKEKGNTDFKAGNNEGAVLHYTEGIEQDPYNKNLVSVLYANRAAAYLKLKKYEEAVQDCTKAIELNDAYAKAYLRRGEIRMEMGEYEEASRDFNKAHQLDPHLGARQRIKEAELEAKKKARKDYYKILEVDKNVTEEQLKKAYKKMALKWHPDKNSADEASKTKAEAMFKDINEAYSVLSDPQKRQRYDSGADLEDEMGGAGFGDPNDIFRMFFGGGGGGDGGFGGFPGGFFGGNMGGGGSKRGAPGGFSYSFKMG